MRCTLTELRNQPMAELEIFMAFIAGEGDGQKAVREAN